MDKLLFPLYLDWNLLSYIESFFLVVLLVISIAFTFSKDLLTSIFLLISFSLSISLLYLIMYAPDVSMTEAAVGACLTTVIPLAALNLFSDNDLKCSIKKSGIALIICIIIAIALGVVAFNLPIYGDFKAPIHQHVAPYYIQNSGKDIGIVSVVASILASYRGFDTLGETVVILTAGLSIFMMLYNRPSKKTNISCQRDVLISSITKIIFPIIFIYGLYIQIHGEISPGGGFQAGAILASAFILCCIANNSNDFTKIISLHWLKAIAVLGVLLYASVGLISIYYGQNFLDYSSLAEKQITGQTIGIFIIEIGVGATVFSVLTLIFLLFAGREASNDS